MNRFEILPDTSTIPREGCQLLLYPVHPVDTVEEQDQDENEGDLTVMLTERQ